MGFDFLVPDGKGSDDLGSMSWVLAASQGGTRW